MITPTSTPSSSNETSSTALLDPFLSALSDPTTSIPASTIHGALAHFLSTLPPPLLARFVSSIALSPILWPEHNDLHVESPSTPAPGGSGSRGHGGKDGWAMVDGAREAIRLGVMAKVANDGTGKLGRRQTWRLRRWLRNILEALDETQPRSSSVLKSQDTESSTTSSLREPTVAFTGRAHILTSLLVALDETQIDWGRARVKLEEEIVVCLHQLHKGSTLAATSTSSAGVVEALYSAIPHIDSSRLSILDLSSIVPDIQNRLFTYLALTPSSTPPSPSSPPRVLATSPPALTLVHALTCSLQVLRMSSPALATSQLELFTSRMTEIAAQVDRLQATGDLVQSLIDHYTVTLEAFTIVALAAAYDLITTTISPPTSDPSTSSTPTLPFPLPSSFLLILADLAPIPSPSPDIETLTYACLDLVAASSGASDKLVHELCKRRGSGWRDGEGSEGGAQRDAFALFVAEQLVSRLEGASVASALAVAERWILRSEHRQAFDASHAFILSVFSAFTSTDAVNRTSSLAFIDSLLAFYVPLVIKLSQSSELSTTQILNSVPPLISTSSLISPSHLASTLTFLSNLSFPLRLLALITASPHLPTHLLPSHLEDIAASVLAMGTDHNPNPSGEGEEGEAGEARRVEIVAACFKMVAEGLGDEGKVIGVRWWERYRERFAGGPRPVRARL